MIDDWIIFVYNQADSPVAAVFLTGDDGYFEIFGVESADGVFRENVFRELLAASLNECKRLGAEYMTYFCGEEEKHILAKLGFKCIGQYALYIKVLLLIVFRPCFFFFFPDFCGIPLFVVR